MSEKTERFGIIPLTLRRKCSHWLCRKPATIVIGDVKQPYSPLNFCLCEEHLSALKKELLDVESKTVGETPETAEKVAGNPEKEEFIKVFYENNGRISKADIISCCKTTGVELPNNADEMKVKELLEIMFPNLKETEEKEEK